MELRSLEKLLGRGTLEQQDPTSTVFRSLVDPKNRGPFSDSSRSVAGEIRALNPLLFQRFDDVQLDRPGCPLVFERHPNQTLDGLYR